MSLLPPNTANGTKESVTFFNANNSGFGCFDSDNPVSNFRNLRNCLIVANIKIAEVVQSGSLLLLIGSSNGDTNYKQFLGISQVDNGIIFIVYDDTNGVVFQTVSIKSGVNINDQLSIIIFYDFVTGSLNIDCNGVYGAGSGLAIQGGFNNKFGLLFANGGGYYHNFNGGVGDVGVWTDCDALINNGLSSVASKIRRPDGTLKNFLNNPDELFGYPPFYSLRTADGKAVWNALGNTPPSANRNKTVQWGNFT